MKKLFASIALLLPLSAIAEEPLWAKFRQEPVNGLNWEYKRKSLDTIKDDSGNMYWTVLFRTSPVNGDKFNFMKIAVSMAQCVRQSGKIILLETDNTKIGETAFVIGGETLGSNIAESICEAGKMTLDKLNQEKQKQEEEAKKIST